jgi:hypothetical protein
MWMAKGRYEDVIHIQICPSQIFILKVSQSILALQQESIKAVMEDGNEAVEVEN